MRKPWTLPSAWESSARRRLAAGDSARDAFLGLVLEGAEPDTAAVAVGVAAGSPAEEAVRRLRDFAGVGELPAEDAADLLAGHGYFEPDAVLEACERRTSAGLRAAIRAAGRIPGGYPARLHTQLRTGRLTEAFLGLELLGGRRWADNLPFWTALLEAGENLGGPDVGEALARCRERVVSLRP